MKKLALLVTTILLSAAVAQAKKPLAVFVGTYSLHTSRLASAASLHPSSEFVKKKIYSH